MIPPFTLTPKILNLVAAISQFVGHFEYEEARNLHLRKENRIQTIHASLAIERNSLTLAQVTDIINGKRVLGKPQEIQEVKNAFEAYELLLSFNPYSLDDLLKAHGILSKDLVKHSGQLRKSDVGIFDDAGNVVHMGARPEYLAKLITDLLDWGRTSDLHELIKSAVIHYELEVIHPFEDGNGRMGRLWQTLVLSQYHELFAWLPIETLVYEHQSQYYTVLAEADKLNESTPFIEFMLETILETLEKASDKQSDKASDKLSKTEQKVWQAISNYLAENDFITTGKLNELISKSSATSNRYLQKFVTVKRLIKVGDKKATKYFLNDLL